MSGTRAPQAYESIRARVLDWIEQWEGRRRGAVGRTGHRFEALALDLFRFQFDAIEPFRDFCAARDRTPDTVRGWRDVPLVPVSAFKHRPMATLVAVVAPECVFETSGTSDGNPGRVTLGDRKVYDASLRASFRHWVVPDGRPGTYRCISLVPGRGLRPRSSLGHMVETLFERWDDGGGAWHLRPSDGATSGDEGVIDLPALMRDLRLAALHRVPVLLFATSLALERTLSRWPEGVRIPLPAGSRVMDTGGPKGRTLAVGRQAQHETLCGLLGLAPWQVVGELGMTELCSQRYETTVRAQVRGDEEGRRAYAAPPWLRSVVLEPGSLQPACHGEVGLIGHVDLANIDTCAFVLTADLGRIEPLKGAGDALSMAGRVPGAEWRGCGLDVEDLIRS